MKNYNEILEKLEADLYDNFTYVSERIKQYQRRGIDFGSKFADRRVFVDANGDVFEGWRDSYLDHIGEVSFTNLYVEMEGLSDEEIDDVCKERAHLYAMMFAYRITR